MTSSSDGEYAEMEIDDRGEWKQVCHRRKRSRDPNSPTELLPNNKKITTSTRQTVQATIEFPPTIDKRHMENRKNYHHTAGENSGKYISNITHEHHAITTADKIQNKNTIHKQNNYSQQMIKQINKFYKHLFYITTKEEISRIRMADIWTAHFPQNRDILIKTKKGFIIKTDNDKSTIIETLHSLKDNIITTFEESKESIKPSSTKNNINTYSVVIGQVDQEVTDEEISNELNNRQIEHRFCKRITSRATGKPTFLIRIITGCVKSFECLLKEGFYYKCRHYPVFSSLPPQPVPIPCGKCSLFTHTTENCNTPLQCDKCKGNHKTNKCTSPLPSTCKACGSTEHEAWSMKCPKRPIKPIAGIPNVRIKSNNKRSPEVNKRIRNKSRIHNAYTTHDFIVDTYINKLNNPKNTNRQELLNKLKKRFIESHNIDTTTVFSGNKIYILMFDLDKENSNTATEPKEGTQIQYNG